MQEQYLADRQTNQQANRSQNITSLAHSDVKQQLVSLSRLTRVLAATATIKLMKMNVPMTISISIRIAPIILI